MNCFLFGPENCMSCVRLREGGGSPQVKQLFEDEIIVWLHLFTPMAQRGAAKQHNWLCYLMAASTSLCKDIFQRVWLKDILSGSWLCHQTICKANIQVMGCLFPATRNSFWMCQLKETQCTYVLKTALWHVVRAFAAHLLLSGAFCSICCFVPYINLILCLSHQRFWWLGTCLFYSDSVGCCR